MTETLFNQGSRPKHGDIYPCGQNISDRTPGSACVLHSRSHGAAGALSNKLSNEWILTAALISMWDQPSYNSRSLLQPQSHKSSGQDLDTHKNHKFHLKLIISTSEATSAHLHFEKLLFIFFQRFNFLLRKRNYWFELGIMVGLICILSGGIVVLMGVLCRKVCEEVTTGGKPGLQATAWAFLLMNGLISKQEFKPTTFNMKRKSLYVHPAYSKTLTFSTLPQDSSITSDWGS